MPKDPVKQEEVKDKPVIEVVPEEHKESADVEVDLNASKPGDAAPDPTERLRNQMFYEMRQQEKRIQTQNRQMMEEMVQRMSPNQGQPQKGSEELDDFDPEAEREAQTNWQRGVKKLVRKDIDALVNEKLEEKLKAREEEYRVNDTRQHALRVEARGREKVLTEFPSIVDESTPEFKAYMEIYNRETAEDPSFVWNPRKHELILPELREKMGSRKIDVNPEIDRLKRVAAGSTTPSRPNNESNKIMLSQDEITMCKRSGIPVETYARTKKLGAAGLKEGVVIDE